MRTGTGNKVNRKVLDAKNPYGLPDNPKDLVGQTKLDLSLIPETFVIEVCMAFYEGALKYGRFNWRMRPVRASVYLAAFERHILKYKAGEERDRATGTHHLGYAGCCLAIIYDAQKYGTLIDDRAPRGFNNPDISAELDNEIMARVAHLKDLFKDEKPYQYTIRDNIFDIIENHPASPASNPKSQRRSTVRSKRRGK